MSTPIQTVQHTLDELLVSVAELEREQHVLDNQRAVARRTGATVELDRIHEAFHANNIALRVI